MTNFDNITKEIFINAYNDYPPNKWISFAYKYFSSKTEANDLSLKNNIVVSLICVFLLGLLGTILKLPRIFILIPTLIYTVAVFVLVLYITSAVILNNIRLKRIMNFLEINKDEYKALVNKYF